MKKTRLASVRLTAEGSVVVCLKSAGRSSCLYFEKTEQLAEAIQKKQIRVKNWIVSMPDSLCITKTIELPANDIGQAYKMLEFELPSYLPLPAEELVYGCAAMSRDGNLLKVSVYILRLTSLEEVLAKFKSVGIRPCRVLVDSVAVQGWFGRDRGGGGEIDLVFGNEHFFAAAGRESSFQRYNDILDLQSQREDVVEEVDRLAAEIFGDKEESVLKIAAQRDIQAEIKGWFAGDFKKIEFLELPDLNFFAGGVSLVNDFGFESVVGEGLLKVAEESDFSFLNLLPRNVLERVRQKQVIFNAGVTAVVSVFVVFCLWLNFAVMNWRIAESCGKIAREIAPIKHIAAEVESKREKVRAIEAQLSNREEISGIFSHLYKYSPGEISISQLNYSSKADTATLNIKGQADTLSNAFEYSEAMKESELLNNIQIIGAQQIPRPGGSIVEFKAQCTMRGN